MRISSSPSSLVFAASGCALIRATRQPTFEELDVSYRFLREHAKGVRRIYGTLFGARAFRDLVSAATDFVATEMAPGSR
jgi:hypothetical protein